jgi:hypothetical protein
MKIMNYKLLGFSHFEFQEDLLYVYGVLWENAFILLRKLSILMAENRNCAAT